MERTEQWTLKSTAGRTFEISVSRPREPAPARGYPVIYVLDPNHSFATVTETVRNQERMGLFGPVVIVGVGYSSDAEIANRLFDLTPTTDLENPEVAAGGAEAFLAFLKDDLRAALARSLSIDTGRQALFGHSVGGLFALHVLFTHPEAFDTYIAGSPSIWWAGSSILKEVPAFKARAARNGAHRRLLITVGELEATVNPEEIQAFKEQKISDEYVRNADMVNKARSLAAHLKSLAVLGLEVEYTSFPDETHNSVIPAYLGRGTRFTLSGWFN
jgi:predicted alpha/beta superfamily hydrolase